MTREEYEDLQPGDIIHCDFIADGSADVYRLVRLDDSATGVFGPGWHANHRNEITGIFSSDPEGNSFLDEVDFISARCVLDVSSLNRRKIRKALGIKKGPPEGSP